MRWKSHYNFHSYFFDGQRGWIFFHVCWPCVSFENYLLISLAVHSLTELFYFLIVPWSFLYILIIHLLSDMQWVKIFFQSVLIPTWLPISMYCRSLLVSYSLIYQLLMFAELLESSSESICLHLHCTNFHIFPVAVQSLMSYPKIFHTFRTALYRLKYGMISSFSRII